jgi:hypothetical protein
MTFKEIIAVYQEFSQYLKENTKLHHYKDQLVNAVQGINPCLQWDSHKAHKYKMHGKVGGTYSSHSVLKG